MNNNVPTIFDFKGNEVRVFLINGDVNQPYFCLRDVCNVLDIKQTNIKDFDYLDINGVKTINVDVDSIRVSSNNVGGVGVRKTQDMTFISEPNLYRVIFKSRKENATQFQNWVFDEVLPSIRKTGGYSMLPKTLSEALRAYANELDEKERLALINKKQEVKIQQDAPKVQMAEDFLIVDDAISMEAMAKLLCNIEGVKIGRTRLYSKLREWGVVMPNTTTPYQKFIDSELFACREKHVERSNGDVEIKVSTLVTPKGQLALIKKVRKLLKEGTWSN